MTANGAAAAVALLVVIAGQEPEPRGYITEDDCWPDAFKRDQERARFLPADGRNEHD